MDNLEYIRVVTKLREIGRDANKRADMGARDRVLSQQGLSKKVALVWMGLSGQRNVRAISPEMIIEATDTPFYTSPLDRRSICGLFKSFENLGLGKYHQTSEDGHPEGTLELYANCNDIGNAARGFAHLLDVVRPNDKQLTGTARDQHIANRLVRMGGMKSVRERSILSWLAESPHMKDGTPVWKAAGANRVGESIVSELFQDLETIGVGRFVEDLKGDSPHMEWHASSQEVGKAACGMDHDLRVAGPGFRDDGVVVERPDGLINRVRNGDNEAAILIEIQDLPDLKGSLRMLDLKMISNLGSFAGEIPLNKGEDWRDVLANMSMQEFLQCFGGDRSKAPIHAQGTRVAYMSSVFASRAESFAGQGLLEARVQQQLAKALSYLDKGTPEGEKAFLELSSKIAQEREVLHDLLDHVQRATPAEVDCLQKMWEPFQEDLKAEMKNEQGSDLGAPGPAPR